MQRGLDGRVVSWSRQTKRSKKSSWRAHTGEKHRTSRYHRLKNTWGHTGHTGHKVQTMRRFGSSGVYQYVELGTQAYRACSAPQGAIKVKGPKPSLFICRLGALGNLRLSATASSLLLGLGYRFVFTNSQLLFTLLTLCRLHSHVFS